MKLITRTLISSLRGCLKERKKKHAISKLNKDLKSNSLEEVGKKSKLKLQHS